MIARNAREHTTVIYRDAEPARPGWNDRYERPRTTTTTYENHYYYESRSPSPRVVVRYDNRPRYRYSRRWGYNDPYCR